MAINEQEIQEIVRSVLKGMGTTAARCIRHGIAGHMAL